MDFSVHQFGMRRERGRVPRLARHVFLACVVFAMALAVVGLTPRAALADSITYDLGTPNAVMSAYPSPYGTVTVTWVSSTTATVQFQAASTGGYYYLFGAVNAMAVNVNATSFGVSNLTASGGNLGGDLKSTTAGNVSEFGSFDLRFKNKGGAENAFLTGSFTLTDKSGTWANAADVLTANADGNFVAAHIFVYDNAGYDGGALSTGFVGDGDNNTTEEVPEPASMAIVAAGIAGMAGYLWRRRRKLKVNTAAA